MTTRMPTERGDVLVLRTDHTFTLYAVGRVTKNGQQDFAAHAIVHYTKDQATALAEAKAMVGPGRRIFLEDIDTSEWSELSI